jgi:RimJ/RimL family protein N-acetyltransferase
MVKRNDWTSGDHASWLVSTGGGSLVGSVSLHHIDLAQENAEVGYWIAPEFRGRHLAARSVDIAARFAFATLGFRRLYLYHSVENPASCRVADRAGFAMEGTLRQSYKYSDGRFHDEHLHGRLATDGSPHGTDADRT